jgi:hypothetical protein
MLAHPAFLLPLAHLPLFSAYDEFLSTLRFLSSGGSAVSKGGLGHFPVIDIEFSALDSSWLALGCHRRYFGLPTSWFQDAH